MKIKIQMGNDFINLEAGAESAEMGSGSHYQSSLAFKRAVIRDGKEWPNISSSDLLSFLDASKWKASYEVEGTVPKTATPEKEPEKEEQAEEESEPEPKTTIFSSSKKKKKVDG